MPQADAHVVCRVAIRERARLLRDLSDDERSVAVVASVIGPPTFFALRGRGLSSDDAARLSLELSLPGLERRRDRLAGRSDADSA